MADNDTLQQQLASSARTAALRIALCADRIEHYSTLAAYSPTRVAVTLAKLDKLLTHLGNAVDAIANLQWSHLGEMEETQ